MATDNAPEGFYSVKILESSNDPRYDFTIPQRYTNIEFIGDGNGTVVAKAYDEELQQSVAIKKIHSFCSSKWISKQIRREFVLLTSIQHPAIVKLLDAFSPQTEIKKFEHYYVVMEFMESNLAHVLPRTELTPQHISFITYQLLWAINHLHRSGIIHQDLNLYEIGINSDCTVKLLNFGRDRKSSLDRNIVCFIPVRFYQAPESLFKIAENEKVDIWAIGCIFAELFTKRVLFQGRDYLDQFNKIFVIVGKPGCDFLALLPGRIAEFIRSLPEVPTKPLDEIIPNFAFPEAPDEMPEINAENARDLLSHMLKINPNERFSAEECLKQPFFKPWFEEEDIDFPASPNRYDENIAAEKKSLAEWKTLIFTELMNFRSGRQ